MNLSLLSPSQMWQLLGWTMILFLAAGTVVLLLGGALRWVSRHANPMVRYATSLVTFTMLAILPIAIAGYLATNSLSNPTRQRGELTPKYSNDAKELFSSEAARVAAERSSVSRRSQRAEDPPRKLEPVADERTSAPPIDIVAILNQSAHYLPWLWCIGTPLTFLLLATGLIGAERLRNSCQLLYDGPIRTACDELRTALGVTRQVGVAVCERIATPILVGVVKPLILLPPAALNGWTTAELEMVLVHELAHVRRWDNAVNLAQRIVESLLFFHPAVWIVSNWVRRDREDCCDVAVVRHTAKPQAYAELLLALASHQPLAGLAATAMAQHPVASRIRRILKIEDEPMLVTRKGLLVGVSAVVVAALLVFALPTTDAEEPQASRQRQRPEDTASPTTETTNPTRQRGEDETTKPEEVLTTEGTEDTEKKSKDKDSVQYTVVYALGEKEAEIKTWLKAVDELADTINIFTKDGKDMAVVTGTRAGHEKLSAMFESIRSEASRQRERPEVTTNSATFTDIRGKTKILVVEIPNSLQTDELRQQALNAITAQGFAAKLSSDSRHDGSPVTNLFITVPSEAVDASVVWEESYGRGGLRPRVILLDEFGKPVNQKPIPELFARESTFVSDDRNPSLGEQATEKAKTTEKNSLFPTLEEQRAADLAYKLLGVELEKLTPEELERVKAKGYQGGLRVTHSKAIAGNELPRADAMQYNDLLVGLHVWPTESLDQVTKILSRDDLDQLSPLKFYVIRGGGTGRSSQMPPLLVTGRIQVDLDAWRAMRTDVSANEKVDGRRTAEDARAAAKKYNDAKLQYEAALELNRRAPGSVADSTVARLKQSVELALRELQQPSAQLSPQKTADPGPAATHAGPNSNPFIDDEDVIFYDGKTFNQWRNLWKRELKTEKRIECIKALAAFGRAGKGEEAAEAILGIADQFDFAKFEGDSAQRLKGAMSEIFIGPEALQGQYWLPLLTERLESDPEKWSSFASWVLGDAQGKGVIPHLKQLAKDDSLSAEARGAALAGMARQPGIAEDAEAVEMVRDSLRGDKPAMQVFNALRFNRLELFPEQYELLFHNDKKIRDQVFGIASSGGTDVEAVLNKLLEALSDPTRSGDHEKAMVALYRLNGYYVNIPERRQPIADKTTEILVSGDTTLLPASLALMSLLSHKSESLVIKELGDKITDERRKELEAAIPRAEELQSERGFGGGGMGGGGMGGGGMF